MAVRARLIKSEGFELIPFTVAMSRNSLFNMMNCSFSVCLHISNISSSAVLAGVAGQSSPVVETAAVWVTLLHVTMAFVALVSMGFGIRSSRISLKVRPKCSSASFMVIKSAFSLFTTRPRTLEPTNMRKGTRKTQNKVDLSDNNCFKYHFQERIYLLTVVNTALMKYTILFNHLNREICQTFYYDHGWAWKPNSYSTFANDLANHGANSLSVNKSKLQGAQKMRRGAEKQLINKSIATNLSARNWTW